MNYFFGFKNESFYSELTIPKFRNRDKKQNKSQLLYSANANNGKWFIKKINCQENDNFYFLKQKDIKEDIFFFLATMKEIENFYKTDQKKLINFNSYSDTWPAFRSNLRIMNQQGGFSSYQSEYPYSMSTKKGSIISSVDLLLNKNAEKNFILFVNIFVEPLKEKFDIFLINLKKKIKLKKFVGVTNQTNFIEISKEHIHQDIYIFTKDFIGIPIFLSEKNYNISFEHTQPPHEYLIGKDKFAKVKQLKEKANEIIYS